jgi:transposase
MRRRRQGLRYLTVDCDLGKETVEHVGEERKQETFDGYYKGLSLSKKQFAGNEAVAIDMLEPYIQSTLAQVPEAAEKIVFDSIHIMGHVGKAANTVRKQEHRELMVSDHETLEGRKYLWLYSRENVPPSRRAEFAALRRGAQSLTILNPEGLSEISHPLLGRERGNLFYAAPTAVEPGGRVKNPALPGGAFKCDFS